MVVTRRFTKRAVRLGNVKNKDGKDISSKKDELEAICGHMSIQVDNPMNVLKQNLRDSFEHGSPSRTRIRSQFLQLLDEYDTCLENITQTARALPQKKDALPDLRKRFSEVTAWYQEPAKAHEQKPELDDLKKELGGSHVAKKEGEITLKNEEVAQAGRTLPKI